MRKFNAENERLKRKYITFIKDTKGRDHKSLDKVGSALVRFEESTGFKPFKKFHIDQAGQFKKALSKARNERTGKPLSLATIDATLRLVKGFFQWLSREQGFKKVLTYRDAEYFNNNAKDARAAHAQREVQFPSMEACAHAFQAMPERSAIERRDKAIFAFTMLTGARVGAVASLKLKHINLKDRHVFQDGREVNTKNSKTFSTAFFPVGKAYFVFFSSWVEFLRKELFFGGEDPLFPAPERTLTDGKFNFSSLSRSPYSNPQKINQVIRTAFAMVQLPEYTPHSLRKTMGHLLSDLNLSIQEQKAWSQNLGHENFSTTVNSYVPVDTHRQLELIAKLSDY